MDRQCECHARRCGNCADPGQLVHSHGENPCRQDAGKDGLCYMCAILIGAEQYDSADEWLEAHSLPTSDDSARLRAWHVANPGI